MIIGTIKKQVSERKDRDIDFAAFFETRPGDYIVNAEVSVDDDTLIVSLDPFTNDSVKLWVEGGIHDKVYLVTLIVSTYMGRTEEHEIVVSVYNIDLD